MRLQCADRRCAWNRKLARLRGQAGYRKSPLRGAYSPKRRKHRAARLDALIPQCVCRCRQISLSGTYAASGVAPMECPLTSLFGMDSESSPPWEICFAVEVGFNPAEAEDYAPASCTDRRARKK